MNITQTMKLNDEIIDSLCSFFKGANLILKNESEIATLYSYLLLQATGIERLQKIVYILEYFKAKGTNITDSKLKKNLGHGILNIHQQHLSHHFNVSDFIYYEKALQLLTELVNVKDGYRYTNFNLHNDERFSVYDHIVKLLELDGIDYSNINDIIKVSWEMMDLILKKYISVLVNLIWHKKVGNGEIMPICLNEYVLKGWQEKDLNIEINKLLDSAREIN